MLIVAKIHNNSLGVVVEVSSWDHGVDVLRKMAQEQLNRPITKAEEDDLTAFGELYDDSDSDNIFTFSIGVVERDLFYNTD